MTKRILIIISLLLFGYFLYQEINQQPKEKSFSPISKSKENAPPLLEKPYVILISLDGFRWDYVERFQPPNLMKFIKNGVQAESLIPVFPSKTFPNHYSIATGMYPENHGLVGNSYWNPIKKGLYKIRDRSKVEDGSWYGGTPLWVAAEKAGYVSASFFFVGSEADVQGIHPTFYYKFNNSIPNEKRVEQVLDWLEMPVEKRPHLITLYFSDMDDVGHDFGPNNDTILSKKLMKLDADLGKLFEEISKIDLPINIFIVSDHGMAAVSPDQYLYEESIENDSLYRTVSNGSFANIHLKDKADKELVFNELKQKEQHFKVHDLADSVYFKSNPMHPNLGDLLIVTEYPYYFKGARSIGLMERTGKTVRGEHGYSPEFKDLHGIFYANGNHLKKGLRIPSFENIHVYPLICNILDIEINEEVDGKLEVLENILK